MSSRLRSLVALAVLALATPLALATNIAPASAAPSVPTGFDNIFVAAVDLPTAMAELPDGRMFVASKNGQLWLLNANGTKPATPAITLGVCADSERGLLGVDTDPAVVTNGYIYVYYTFDNGPGCQNRVSRFTLTGSTVAPASELVLVDGIPATEGNHNGGDVHVGKDGMLYISVGDNGCNPRTPGVNCAGGNPAAKNRALPNGKILRVNLDGSIPGSNPYTGAGTARCNTGPTTDGTICQEIVAYGLRNPFRFVPDQNAPGTKFFINDVGQDTTEEIDQFQPGANYGWNDREGFCAAGGRTDCNNPPAGVTDPIFDYTHAAAGCDSITGGAFVPATGWPAAYAGGYLYSDFICQKIFALLPNGDGTWTSQPFADGVGGVVDMRAVSRLGAWSIYYTTFANGGEVRRIVSTTAQGETAPSTFHPLAPVRVLDTRDGTTGYSGRKPAAGETISLQVTGGASGVPSDAITVAVNLTGTESAAAGYVTVWPTGEPRPLASALNFSGANDTAANAVIMRLGSGGQINLFTQSSAHLVADVTGYWTAAANARAGRYTPAPTPARLLDTRTGNGAPVGLVPAGGSLDLQVGGRGGVPSTGVSAVALTVTVTNTVTSGYVTAWPTGTARPLASSVNPVGANDIRSNLVMLPLGTGGKVSLYTLQGTHLVVDVAGWFTDSTAPDASTGLLVATSPTRLVYTPNNSPFGRLNAGDTGIVNFSPAVGTGAIAIVHNLTVTDTAGAGFLTAWPGGQARPTASNLNWNGAKQIRAALAISSLQSGSEVAYFPNVATDLIIDRSGYFTA